MSLFDEFGIKHVRHFAPLHYLTFIARSASLLSKPSLRAQGFERTHLRAKSHEQDVQRGFGDCAFLTLDHKARILKAKLAGGFPHIGVAVPAPSVEATNFSLCRYNVAMTRRLRRDGKPGFEESPSNGRYDGNRQIPIASTEDDKRALLGKHYGTATMIEVLIHGNLPLPEDSLVICFCQDDVTLASRVLAQLNCGWKVVQEAPPAVYRRNGDHVRAVEDFIDNSLRDPNWRGNGLDFDRV